MQVREVSAAPAPPSGISGYRGREDQMENQSPKRRAPDVNGRWRRYEDERNAVTGLFNTAFTERAIGTHPLKSDGSINWESHRLRMKIGYQQQLSPSMRIPNTPTECRGDNKASNRIIKQVRANGTPVSICPTGTIIRTHILKSDVTIKPASELLHR
jgi:hypothetical protein